MDASFPNPMTLSQLGEGKPEVHQSKCKEISDPDYTADINEGQFTASSIIVGMLNNRLAEMTTYTPVSGGFIGLAGYWVVEALGSWRDGISSSTRLQLFTSRYVRLIYCWSTGVTPLPSSPSFAWSKPSSDFTIATSADKDPMV
ncbi:uncharacterized protein BO87DRAFT_389375 [Aspergillus neoniger CBS 115656]|uniref:Uncharacterized protein n=1 Tax=Aspergillus neoniger (strain CBS 115656) TaxID=1448310 RepID=A0A318YG74_ASPNB|nr:hypothetical protein BO87DRAFT_389375 [Aspergillus neoniger CBS 115656]PYH31493.1 hypothetical protein BO87DRAFT_389375 [Aspergillus neoniger CBS 115656]